MATKRCSYTAALKLKLVEYAERHGNTHDALVFLLLHCDLPSPRAIPRA